MDLGRMLTIILVLDALVVLTLGVSTLVAAPGQGGHGAHAGQDYSFLMVNGVRLAIGALILLLWKIGTFSRVQEILLKRPIQEMNPGDRHVA